MHIHNLMVARVLSSSSSSLLNDSSLCRAIFFCVFLFCFASRLLRLRSSWWTGSAYRRLRSTVKRIRTSFNLFRIPEHTMSPPLSTTPESGNLGNMSGSDSSVVRSATPFADADADLVIRSSDNVDYRVFGVILAKASPVFSGMLTLPPPPAPAEGITSGTSSEEFAEGLPLIRLVETSQVIAAVLQFCYPVEDPHLNRIEDVEPVLQAGLKYEIDIVVSAARRTVSAMVESDPFRVLIFACRYDWKDVVQHAAKMWLRRPVDVWQHPYLPELKTISAETFCRLLDYRRQCEQAVAAVLADSKWMRGHIQPSYVACTACASSPSLPYKQYSTPAYSSKKRKVVSEHPEPLQVAKWFADYVQMAGVALQKRPWGAVATETEVLMPSAESVQCATCARNFFAKVHNVSGKLAEAVENAVAKVELKLDF